jgi:hypothetical protein
MTATDGHTATWVPPEVPSKWDIIPIHNSDRGNFKRCRRYWDWTSPARNNLTLRADVYGVNIPMTFGTFVHYGLEQMYQPGIKRDPVEAFCEYFDVCWRGGTVTEEWLPRVFDAKPKPHRLLSGALDLGAEEQQHETWIVRGLEDILPDADADVWDELRYLGIQMLTFYKDYAARNDNFEVLVAEHDFSVPIWDHENQCILKAIDSREDSPNHGKELEVHSRGRNDAIWVKPSGKLGILDHKTAGKIGEEEFRKLDSDEQCTSYLLAAELEANYYDLPHKGEPMEEVIYNVLRKAYPKPPTEIRGGMFSVDREKESTTYEMLSKWIATNLPGVPLSEKQRAYVEYVRDVGDEQFVIRKFVRRNRAQLRNASYRIYLEAMDMLDPNIRIYPNIRNDFSCLNCAFRAPCMAMEDGSDADELITSNYTNNKDR